jgi:hypothetical protein
MSGDNLTCTPIYYHWSPRLQPYTLITVRMPTRPHTGVRALTKVTYRDPQYGSLAIDQGHIDMPHKRS